MSSGQAIGPTPPGPSSAAIPFRQRFGTRLLAATMGAVFVGAFCSLVLIVLGERRMADATAARTEKSIEGFFRERMRENLDTEAQRFARVRRRACDRVAALAAVTQSLFDHGREGTALAEAAPDSGSLRTQLAWDAATGGSQNPDASPVVVAIPPELHAGKDLLSPQAESLVGQTSLLDTILPVLQASEPADAPLYFVGPPTVPLIRMAPWRDLLHDGLDSSPNWPDEDYWAGFPGLIDAWLAWQRQHPESRCPVTALPPRVGQSGSLGSQSFCMPVWDRQRQACIGSVWCDLPLGRLIRELMEYRLGSRGVAFLCLADGTLLAQHEHGGMGVPFTQIHFANLTGHSLRAPPERAATIVHLPLPPEGSSLLVSALLSGEPHLVALRRLPSSAVWTPGGTGATEEQWILGLAIPHSVMAAPVQEARAQIATSTRTLLIGQTAILLATTTLLGLLIWYVLGHLHRRMANMATTVRSIASGVPGARIADQASDELGLVARDVNAMADRLRDMADAAGQRNAELEAMFDALPNLVLVMDTARETVLFANSQAEPVLRSRSAEGARQQALSTRTQPNEPIAWEFRDSASGQAYLVAEQNIHWSDGQPAILAVAIDITRRRQTEASLRELNATLEARVRERTNELREQVRETEVVNRAMVNLLEDLQWANRELAATGRELRAANQELEAFSYSVSHDLRAPLRTISGFSEILLEEHRANLNDEAQEHLGRIHRESQHMGQVIDSLLALSRISRRDLHSESVDLSRLAREVVADLVQEEPDRAVQVSIAAGIEVQGDQRMLRLVLSNLLGNAWKFTRLVPEPHIEFGRLESSHENGKVADSEDIYYVRDNGAGFDMQYANKLFVPFSRLHKPTEYPGTGIGLTTVQRIVQRHGGRIWAEGRPGHGATFFFSLGSPAESPPPTDKPPSPPSGR